MELATELAISWLSNPNTRAVVDEIPALLAKIHQTISDLASPAPLEAPAADEAPSEHAPAGTVRKAPASKGYVIARSTAPPRGAPRSARVAAAGVSPQSTHGRAIRCFTKRPTIPTYEPDPLNGGGVLRPRSWGGFKPVIATRFMISARFRRVKIFS